jgi:ParB/RepB/Spo0J family partition protein
VPAFNLNKGNQTAQNRLKLQKERTESEDLIMPDARRVPLSRIRRNPFQVRQDFDSPEALQALQELADDIRQRDILEPLVVRLIEEGDEEYYEIIAGERRFLAAGMAGKTHAPVMVKTNWSDREARLASLSENLQRRDLNLLEEVHFLLALENEYNYSAKQIGKLINKSESYVSKRLRLAHNPQKLKELSEKSMTLTEALLSKEELTPEDDQAETEEIPAYQNPATTTGKSTSRTKNTLRLAPFLRFHDTLYQVSRQLENQELPDDERQQLLEALVQIEEKLVVLRASLQD